MIAYRRFPARRRRGAALVEGALVLSTTFLLIIGLIVLGLGVVYSILLATLARDGARYASDRGGYYQFYQTRNATGKTAATPEDVYDYAVSLPWAAGIDPNKLTCAVNWDDQSKLPVYYNYTIGKWTTNNVTVKLTYQWIQWRPGAYFGPFTLTSTSVMPMSY
jgi:Flp pilus assembly protein TadG